MDKEDVSMYGCILVALLIIFGAIGFVAYVTDKSVNIEAVRIEKEKLTKYNIWVKLTNNPNNITQKEFELLNIDDRLFKAIDINKINNKIEMGNQ